MRTYASEPRVTSNLTENLRGALFMMLSMAGFAANDAVIKAIAGDFGLFPTIFWRGLVACALLALLAAREGTLGWRPSGPDARFVALRGGAEVVTTLCFLTALVHLPLATATAILQTTPLVVTVAAAVFLREKIGWRRYLAAAVGFGGVLIIVRPGSDGFSIYALAALGAVFGITLRDLATRRLTSAAPTYPIALLTAALITAMGGIGTLFVESTPPDALTGLALTGSAMALIVGYVFGIHAMRSGDIGFVSPFRYSILIWALALGLVFFSEVPDAITLVGVVIVTGTGLFTFARERAALRKSTQ